MEFIDLKRQYSRLKTEIDSNVQKVMAESRFIGGAEVSELEEKLAQYVGRKYCITCGSGTDALLLAYMSYGIGQGDAVFCTDMTFIASVEPACLLGATPVFVDIDLNTYNMEPEKLEEAILRVKAEGRLMPKAVVAVDFLGVPVEFDKISEICSRYGLVLIEDAAQAMGAKYKGKMCGSFGDIACTSFFPSKPLGCYGDGGAVFTDDETIRKLITSIKVHGKGKTKYDNIRQGINSRLDTIQAVVLLAKLNVLEEEIVKRQGVAKRYAESLTNYIKVPFVPEYCRSAFAQFVLLAENEKQKNAIVEHLKKNNIPSISYYPKEMDKMDVFEKDGTYDYLNAKLYAECNLGIPFSPYITDEEQDEVINAIKSFYDKPAI